MNIHIGLLGLILLEYFLFCKCSFSTDKYHISQVKKKRHSIFFTIVILELLILAALRSPIVGADTNMYIKGLNYYKGIDFLEIFTKELVYPYDWEWGYFLFVKILAWLNITDSFFLLIVALIIYIPVLKIIQKYSSSYGMSLLIYFALSLYGYSLCLIRQMIAISICVMSIKYIEEQNIFKFLVLIGIAFTFHYSAVCFLILYLFVVFFEKVCKVLLLFPFFVCLFLVFGRRLINIIIIIFPAYSHFVGGKYDVRGGSYLMLLMLMCFFVFTIFYIKVEKKLSFIMKLSISALLIGILVQAMAYSMIFFSRVMPYYTIFLTILIPEEVRKVFRGESKWIVSLSCYIVFGGLFLHSLSKDSYGIIPYFFFWQ